jgi:hypothetical protein
MAIESKEDWKALALFLLNCHAATCACVPKSYSKSAKERYLAIAESAIEAYKIGYFERSRNPSEDHIVEHTIRSIETLKTQLQK